MTKFSELPIASYMQERLAAAQFTVSTPVQAATIPVAVEGKDVFATAQTGTGKTLAFLVPIMQRLTEKRSAGIAALILVPTRELAMQVVEQYDALRGDKLPAAALVVGGMAERPQLTQLRTARVVVATPGRLEDFLDRRLVTFRTLETLVLDEADRMLDMGFQPAIRRIAATLPTHRQTMCFSATLIPSVADVVDDYLRSPVRLSFGSTLKPASNVKVQAIEVCKENKQETLQRLLRNEDGRCLVFARTKRGTERLAKRLSREGFATASLHGDRTQSQRVAALSGFQQGRFQVLVATDVASRGIHVQDIAHVINYDLPEIAEDFIHRVGRTGRAGGSGLASTLFESHEATELRDLERTLGIRIERKTLGAEKSRVTLRRCAVKDDAPVAAASRELTEREIAPASTNPVVRMAAGGRSSLTALPGEFLQNARQM